MKNLTLNLIVVMTTNQRRLPSRLGNHLQGAYLNGRNTNKTIRLVLPCPNTDQPIASEVVAFALLVLLALVISILEQVL